MSNPVTLDINGVMRLLPHRYPFLLVDRVTECLPNQSIRALKNVTYNEPFFTGHFPERPVMPGVIIIEALAQVAGLLAFITANAVPNEHTRVYIVGVDKARFRKPVEPGDQLILKADVDRVIKGIWRLNCVAEVAGDEVAHAQIMISPDLKSVVSAAKPEMPSD